jgi:hypothetical protein
MLTLERSGKLQPEQRTCFISPRPQWELYDLQRDPHELVNRIDDAAYSQVKGLKNHPHMLAYSMRTERHRYIEWRDVSDAFKLVNTELYDLGVIGAERTNVADDPEQAKVLQACRALMNAGYSTLPTAK